MNRFALSRKKPALCSMISINICKPSAPSKLGGGAFSHESLFLRTFSIILQPLLKSGADLNNMVFAPTMYPSEYDFCYC